MYIRKEAQQAIKSVRNSLASGEIDQATAAEMEYQIKSFNFRHHGYSRHDYNYYFIFWSAEHVYKPLAKAYWEAKEKRMGA